MSNDHHHYEHDQWRSSWSMIIIKLNDHHDLIATSSSRCCAWCTSSSRRTSGSEGTRQLAPCPRPRTPPPPTSSSFQRPPLLRLIQLLSRLAMFSFCSRNIFFLLLKQISSSLRCKLPSTTTRREGPRKTTLSLASTLMIWWEVFVENVHLIHLQIIFTFDT